MILNSIHPITTWQSVPKDGKQVMLYIPIGRVLIERKNNTIVRNFHVEMRNELPVIVHSRSQVDMITRFYNAQVQWNYTYIDPSHKYGDKKILSEEDLEKEFVEAMEAEHHEEFIASIESIEADHHEDFDDMANALEDEVYAKRY